MPIKPYVLVVGGAGYIGSHMVLALKEAGYQPLVLDNLSKGHKDAVIDAEFILGDIADREILSTIFTTYPIIAVMHFASLIEVGESVQFPAKYYQNNVAGTLTLLDVMLEHKINTFIFSSSAAVYGEPLCESISENHRLAPINPYGKTKWMIEEVVQDYAKSTDLNYAILRYFNAAGADPKQRLRERHSPESHLIPILLEVAAGKRNALTVNGNDYQTKDGTCVRDFIHVTDLCDAHLLALKILLDNKKNLICNLGTGQGYSVQEVIDAAKKVTQKPIAISYGARRAGDPAVLVANAQLAKTTLNWQPKYSDLHTIIQHAWQVFE